MSTFQQAAIPISHPCQIANAIHHNPPVTKCLTPNGNYTLTNGYPFAFLGQPLFLTYSKFPWEDVYVPAWTYWGGDCPPELTPEIAKAFKSKVKP